MKKNPRDLHLKEEFQCCQVLSFPAELGYFHTVAAGFLSEIIRPGVHFPNALLDNYGH